MINTINNLSIQVCKKQWFWVLTFLLYHKRCIFFVEFPVFKTLIILHCRISLRVVSLLNDLIIQHSSLITWKENYKFECDPLTQILNICVFSYCGVLTFFASMEQAYWVNFYSKQKTPLLQVYRKKLDCIYWWFQWVFDCIVDTCIFLWNTWIVICII